MYLTLLRQNGKDPSDSGDPDLLGYPPLAANWLQPPQWQYGVHFPVPVTALDIPVSPAHPFPASHLPATVCPDRHIALDVDRPDHAASVQPVSRHHDHKEW